MTIAARNPERLEQAAAEIARETGIGVGWVSADLTQPAGRDAAIAACPHPDILINNADGPLPETSATGRTRTGSPPWTL